MHFKKVKGILSAQNRMNIYRGCSHGCIYCDSRSDCYNIEHAFEDIEIKENALELLEDKLKSKRKKCMIGTGSMSDPYIPLEEQLQYTKKSLEIIEKYGFGLAIQTKSNRILRDLEILKKINQKAKCVVQITLTTFDERLCKILEPNVCTTKERFEVLKVMRDNGIPTIVWITPILPFINDNEENLRGILNYCIEARVYGIIIFNMGLTLRDGDREYFYKKLDEHFPGLKKLYQQKYGNNYDISSDNSIKLQRILYDECAKNNIICDVDRIFNYLLDFPFSNNEEKGEQLNLFNDVGL